MTAAQFLFQEVSEPFPGRCDCHWVLVSGSPWGSFLPFFRDLRGWIRESVRPFRGAATAAKFPFQGVSEAWWEPSASRLPESLRDSPLPWGQSIEVSKNAKRFCQPLEMLGRRRNTVKIGILAVFGPKPWTPPRRAENGPPTLFDDQPNGRVWDTEPETRFSASCLFYGDLRDTFRESVRSFRRSLGSRFRESLRVCPAFLADHRGPIEGVPESFYCLFTEACGVRSGSQWGLSGRLRRPLQWALSPRQTGTRGAQCVQKR